MLRFDLTALAQQTDAALIEAEWQLFKVESRLGATQGRFNRQATPALARELNALEAEANRLIGPVRALNEVHGAYRWNRAWLVSGGHLHKSTGCSTCFPTTQFHLMPQCSGLTEEQIVELAGERACTVCYPSAPVEVRSRPSDLRTPDEIEAIKVRVAQEDKRTARERAKVEVVFPGGERETFGTVRSAQNEIGNQLWWALSAINTEPFDAAHATRLGQLSAEHEDKARAILTVLIGRRDYAELRKADGPLHIDTVWADLKVKAEKKYAADVRKAQREEAARKARR